MIIYMRPIKYIISILAFIFILIVSFYFWAKSPTEIETKYNSVSCFTNSKQKAIKDTFSIMTYNIGYLSGMTNNLPVERNASLFSQNLINISTLFNQLAPDIVCFQEIDFKADRSFHTNQYTAIAKNGHFHYGAKAINWDKKYVPFPYWPIKYQFGKILSGQACLSKYEITNSSRVVLPQPKSNAFYYNDFYLDRLAQIVWIKTTKDSILIINVHLEAWDSPTRETQAQIIINLLKKYENKYPLILAGDFNAVPYYDPLSNSEKTIELILQYPHISTAITKDEYLSSPQKFYSFDSRRPYQKIDYIFFSDRYLTCTNAKVIHNTDDISDHLPIFASFLLKP